MEKEFEKRTGFAGGVARALNAGGRATVYAYDVTAEAFTKAMSVTQKVPTWPGKAKTVLTSGFGLVKPDEGKQLRARIGDCESRLKQLYFEIGREGAQYEGDEGPLETEAVKALIAEVRETENEIQDLEDRITEIEAAKRTAAKSKKRLRIFGRAIFVKEKKADESGVIERISRELSRAVGEGAFDTPADQEIFSKIAGDLMDSEEEIRILAAAELGKIGNPAAVPVLDAVIGYDAPNLTTEVINALITIGDDRALKIFFREVHHDSHRVRVGCLRGLYKIGDNSEAAQVLIEALSDSHPTVRQSAAPFIGWKNISASVSALILLLRDDDDGVRKAVVGALANIRDEAAMPPLIRLLADEDLEVREKTLEALSIIAGQELEFDVEASGAELEEGIEKMRQWWQSERPEADDTAVEPVYTKSKLERMTKAQLAALCSQMGIDADVSQLKAEIIRQIMEKAE